MYIYDFQFIPHWLWKSFSFHTETLFEQNHLRIMYFLIIHCSAKKTIFVHWSKISIRLRFEALFMSYNRNNELIPVGQGCEKSFAAIDHLRSDGFKVSSGNEITMYFRNHVVAKKLSSKSILSTIFNNVRKEFHWFLSNKFVCVKKWSK